MRISFLAVLPATLIMTGAAFAQAPAATPPGAVQPSQGVVAPQPGSTGAPGTMTVNPTGRPGDTITNNSAAGGNADQPSRVVPQGGGGGGSK